MTEDKENEIKEVFNDLIVELKNQEFNFELGDGKKDLYFLVSKEYIKHLNTELSNVYKELQEYGLLNKED